MGSAIITNPGERVESRTVERTAAVPLSTINQLAIFTTLAAYCTVILVGVSHHAPWADEAQAWVLSRDLGYRYLIFHQIAYEGHPPLWFTILWVVNHWFHLPYQSIGWIGGFCAIAGCWLFCRYSPFPLWVRILFPFTYFIAFQYAVVARDYVLLPLLTFAAALFFGDVERRPSRFVAAASALMLLCAPGAMIAVGLMAARVWYTYRSWWEIPAHARRRLIAAAVGFGLVLALVARTNWPPADRTLARTDRQARAGYTAGNFGFAAVPDEIAVAFLGSPIPSMAFLALVGVWCAFRRRFLAFALPLLCLLAFFVKVYGSLWHCGALTLIAVAACWIAWPFEASGGSKLSRGLNVLMVIGLAGFFAIQIYWAGRTFYMDYSRPYSGSADAATFLHSVGADRNSTCGFGFHSVALQPYFPHGVYKNWPNGESFWRFEEQYNVDDKCYGAKWIVAPICCSFRPEDQHFLENDRAFRSFGYAPVHVSRGAMFFEGHEAEPTDFVIYERAR